jgi:uncharacterized membrane protein YbhN (UPF0104 family)
MNKTQKGTWCTIAATIFVFTIVFYLIFQIGIRRMAPSRIGVYIILCGAVLFPGIFIYFLRKKQSPKEPDSDERDKQINQKAWIAAFISTWALFLAASVVTQFLVGLDGSIPVFILPIVTVGLSYPVLFIYAIAVLIQYSRTDKGEKL